MADIGMQEMSVTKETVTVPAAEKQPYEPTPRELAALDAARERREARKPSPAMKATTNDGVCQIEVDHPDGDTGFRLLMEAFGTSSVDFVSAVTAELAAIKTRSNGDTDTKNINHALSLAKGVQPRDEVESMLAAQMAAVHMTTMLYAHRVHAEKDLHRTEVAERGLNKLARTFATQVEALKRYRSKGEQRVIVERVDVREGGQAIVGSVGRG